MKTKENPSTLQLSDSTKANPTAIASYSGMVSASLAPTSQPKQTWKSKATDLQKQVKARWTGKCPSVPKPKPSGKADLQHGAHCMMERQNSMDMGHKEDFLLHWEA